MCWMENIVSLEKERQMPKKEEKEKKMAVYHT